MSKSQNWLLQSEINHHLLFVQNIHGSDELMLTRRQIPKIEKSLANGTGSDIKISRTQIRKSVKHTTFFVIWIFGFNLNAFILNF